MSAKEEDRRKEPKEPVCDKDKGQSDEKQEEEEQEINRETTNRVF